MKTLFVLPATLAVTSLTSQAATTFLTDGTTSVDLDTDLLSNAAGLTLSTAMPTATPSAGFLAGFDINARSGGSLNTTFAFDDTNVAPFSGTIEHTGTVTFNEGLATEVTVGNFRIGYDDNRVSAANSGFFVESTTGLGAILFDIGVLNPVPTSTSLTVTGSGSGLDAVTGGANLYVSPELAGVLNDDNFAGAGTDLTGADVGSARIDGIAVVPEPSSALLGLAGLAGLALRRRR